MQKYRSIWRALKEKKICIIAAHPALHKRIIKAVIGEKYRDITFRYENVTANIRIRISHKIEGSRITFRLHRYFILTGVSLDQL